MESFKEFYTKKTKHRKLTWIFSLGQCNLNGKFEQKTIELTLGTYQVINLSSSSIAISWLETKYGSRLITSLFFQAAVLLLFNTSDRWSYSDIKTQLNLADDDLVRVLASVSCAKYKILNKEPSSKSVSSTDQFEFNSQFTDKMRRIRV